MQNIPKAPYTGFRYFYALLAMLAIGLGACSDNGETPDPREPASEVDIETLAAELPTFDLRTDPTRFAEMLAKPEEDLFVEAQVHLWRGDRQVLNSALAEVEIKGGGPQEQALKSLGLKFDSDVDNRDNGVLRVPAVLEGQSLSTLRSLRLRNGGGDFAGTMLKDLAYARLVAGSQLRVVPFYGEPAATFVNGKFYGLLNIRTEANANGLSRLLGVQKSSLHIAELDGNQRTGAQQFDIKDGDGGMFRALEARIAARDRSGALALIDEASFIDFVLVGTLFAHWDWPYKNVRAYAVEQGPIRFCVFDFDEASRLNVDRGIAWHMRERPTNPVSQLFALFYEDDSFRQRLFDRRDALLASGELSPAQLRANFTALPNAYDPVIDYQTALHGVPESKAAWYLQLERHVEDYETRYAGFAREERP